MLRSRSVPVAPAEAAGARERAGAAAEEAAHGARSAERKTPDGGTHPGGAAPIPSFPDHEPGGPRPARGGGAGRLRAGRGAPGARRGGARDVTLEWLAQANATEERIFRQIATEYEAASAPHKVAFINPGDTSWQVKLETLARPGTPPDVVWHGPEWFPGVASKGIYRPLDAYVAKLPRADVADFFPRVLEQYQWEGKQYGIPASITVMVLFYNKDLFDREGLAYPDATWTFEGKYLDAARRLTKREGERVAQYGVGNPHRDWVWPWAGGAEYLDKSGKQVILQPEPGGGALVPVRRRPAHEAPRRPLRGGAAGDAGGHPAVLPHRAGGDGDRGQLDPLRPQADQAVRVGRGAGPAGQQGPPHAVLLHRRPCLRGRRRTRTRPSPSAPTWPTRRPSAPWPRSSGGSRPGSPCWGYFTTLDDGLPPKNRKVIVDALDYAGSAPRFRDFREFDSNILAPQMLRLNQGRDQRPADDRGDAAPAGGARPLRPEPVRTTRVGVEPV